MLVETLLQWESWLKSDKMEKRHVKKAQQKHRYIMYLIKKVGRRTKGMGLKITKFHAIMHIATDILFFGVPNEVDTGSNEAGHKPAKVAAKLTQKKAATFDQQTSLRIEEVHLLDLANEEIQGRPPWIYFDGYEFPEQMEVDEEEPRLGGAKFECYFDDLTGKNEIQLLSRMKEKNKLKVEQDLVDFVVGLQNAVSEYIEVVYLRTNHHRKGQTFRGHMLFNGGIWRDWVMVDWDADGVLPNKIWGFVDLTDLPQNSRVDYGGLVNLMPGLYAIVESAYMSNDEVELNRSEILVSYMKEVGRLENGYIMEQKFYLADVEAFDDPAVVIPDIGGEPNAYFLLKNWTQWCEQFVEWLEDPQEDDYSSSDEESEDDKQQNYDENAVDHEDSDEEDEEED